MSQLDFDRRLVARLCSTREVLRRRELLEAAGPACSVVGADARQCSCLRPTTQPTGTGGILARQLVSPADAESIAVSTPDRLETVVVQFAGSSIVHENVAGVGSVLLAASVATTLKSCSPTARPE